MFNWRVFVAELIGTFALVFIGAGLAASGADALATAAGFGLVLVAFAYAYGSISGTHLNPAVTLAAAINGLVSWGQAIFYWIAQFLGALLATWFLMFFAFGNSASNGLGATTLHVPAISGLVIEALLTFFLVSTVLHTGEHNFGGLAAGFALFFGVLFGFGLTGGSLNPARSFGPAVFTGGLATLDFWLAYFVGPLVGAVLAAFAHRFFSSAMKQPEAAQAKPAAKPAARKTASRRR